MTTDRQTDRQTDRLRIAIFNDFQLPLPAVRGGSVPTLTNFILDQNEIEQKYEFDVFSCYDENAIKESKKYNKSRFIYSKNAGRVRFITNLQFTLKNKFHMPFDLSAVKLPSDVKTYFKNQKYDIVYINAYIRGALPIADIAKQNGAKVIIHHHVVTDLLNDPTIRGAETINKSDSVLFVSDFATNHARVGNDEQNSKMMTFQNAIDTSKFFLKNRAMVRCEIRKNLNIKENDIVILFVGRMVENKGAYELIKGFNDADLSDSVKLVVVGGATYSSKKATSYVQKCFNEAKKNKNIIFTGYVNYNDIPKYYIASDISTLLSRCDEACGLVGIESMAAGLPIITTNRGGICEYVSKDCKIITPDDKHLVKNITTAIQTLANDELLRNKMGAAGVERAKLFDKSQYFTRFSEIVESI